MIIETSSLPYPLEQNCLEAFKSAYKNRYTWGSTFNGYKGNFVYEKNQEKFEGSFELSKDLKITILGLDNIDAKKSVYSQIWEVAIHRVRRDFTDVHGSNTFTFGNQNVVGKEVILGGKSLGDRYRIKDKVVTMVYRHIHGRVIKIYTNSILINDCGYLSNCYTSTYCDPETGDSIGSVNHYTDKFIKLPKSSFLVLEEREILTRSPDNDINDFQRYNFLNLLDL